MNETTGITVVEEDAWPQSWLPGHKVEPLFEGAETFAALEEAIQNATKSVHMAYWVFDPAMDVVSSELDDDIDKWDELIADTVTRGVVVRILLADFDPIVGQSHHRETYAVYRRLMRMYESLNREQKPNLQVIASRHPARVGWFFELVGRYISKQKLNDVVCELNDKVQDAGYRKALHTLGNLPGIWHQIVQQDQEFSTGNGHLPIYLGAHHEKICLVDGKFAYLGGLDVQRKRYDTAAHTTQEAWHDIACCVEGPAVTAFERHFRTRWNNELNWFRDFSRGLQPPSEEITLRTTEIRAFPDRVEIAAPHKKGQCDVRPLRTQTKSHAGWFHRTAKPVISEIATAYFDAIATAENYLFFETQFFRMPGLADRIIARSKERPDLSVILVLPLVPEEIWVSGKPDIASRHGQWLQATAVERLQEALGNKFGVFTLLRNGPVEPEVRKEAVLHGSDLVYVHAKTMISDDNVAIIGSANLNGRSFWCDTETAVAWRGGDSVRAYRCELWRRLLNVSSAEWETPNFLQHWNAIAEPNVEAPPGQRQGFVVPMPKDRLWIHAKRHWLIPEENV